MIAYRFLTGDDDASFCHRVTEALSRGWKLHGAPIYVHDPVRGAMRCGQTVIKEIEGDYAPGMNLSDL